MDSVILAAIIGAAAVIIAAIIGLPKRRVRSGNFEKSQALRLGFAIAGLDYFLRMRKKGVELENRPPTC